MASERKIERKPKILCLHGFRTSGAILRKQVQRWPTSILHQFHLHFIDGPFPSKGRSDVEGIYDPPYFEWFGTSEDPTSCENLESSLEFIESYMAEHGPFDGLLGFSQGAVLSAALALLQARGVALTKVPKIKFVIVISGSKLQSSSLAARIAYSTSIACPSLHFLSEEDFLMPSGLKLLESFVEPSIINHSKGHIVPRLDEKSLKIVDGFIQKVSKL
ncbi:esterase OVCA2 [Cucumis sativus]|uniref:esterase OVCA2 n=1 Tax=Cucumis sativus TaxID=3659 RepID=UPI0002B40E91|nr:esterase OVCA2 [Cucumis sativus]